MNRRRFLAVAGTVVLAGCTADSTSTEDPSTPTSTATATATETTARPTETTTPTPRATSTTPTRAEELIEEGRAHLLAAIDAFTEPAGGSEATILDVTATTTGFSRHDVDEEYRSALLRLEDAKKSATPEEAATADALVEAAAYVETLGFAQLHLVNAHEAVDDALHSLYTESYDNLPDDVDEVARQRRLAGEYADALEADFDAATVEPVDAISGAHYREKLDQVDAELATFDGIVAALEGLQPAMETFADEVGDYRTGNYDDVRFRADDFVDARETVEAIEPAASLEPVVGEMACLFGALADGTEAMADAVFARRNDDTVGARESEEDAEAAYRSCDRLVEEVGPVADLVDSIPR